MTAPTPSGATPQREAAILIVEALRKLQRVLSPFLPKDAKP